MTLPRQIETLSEAQVAELHQLYQQEWWCQGRSLEDVRHMLQHCDLVIGLADAATDRLLAFGRVLTDFTFRATIYDVIVAKDWRGYGLGRLIVDAVVQHPRLKSVAAISLCCADDKIPFYHKWGFQPVDAGINLLQKVQRPG